MDLAPLIYARFGGVTGIGNRLYPDDATPDDPTTPYVVWSESDCTPLFTLDGDTRNDVTRVLFDVYSGDRDECKLIAEAIKNAARDWTSTTTTPRIQRCWVTGETAAFDLSPEGDKDKYYRRTINISFWADF